MTESKDQDAPSQAEELRLQGNEAFSKKDWDIAVHKYQESIKLDGTSKHSAKAHSNLAAALCKLCKYEEAYEAALKAPIVDATWAKGHWRLGVVAELRKDFVHAMRHYEDAVKLNPDESVFRKSRDKMKKRLKCNNEEGPDGFLSVPLPEAYMHKMGEKIPALVAWERYKIASKNLTDIPSAFPKEFDSSAGEDIKSEKWLAHGLTTWFKAMMSQFGEAATLPFNQPALNEVREQLMQLNARRDHIPKAVFELERYNILGCPPYDLGVFQDFLLAITSLCGEHIPCGTTEYIPSPKWLEWHPAREWLAIQQCIFNQTIWFKMMFGDVTQAKSWVMDPKAPHWAGGEELVLSPGILDAACGFCKNIGYPVIKLKEGTPEETLAYCKKKLLQGVSWDVMRKYVSLVYRGTVLSAWLTRQSSLGAAATSLRWARKFIDLADAEWKVTNEGTYDEKGSCFQKSFRAGVLCMELTTTRTRRRNAFPNIEDAIYEFGLAQDIIEFAMTWKEPDDNDYMKWMHYVSCHRKPIAIACTYVAGTLNELLFHPHLMHIVEKAKLLDADGALYKLLDATATQTSNGNICSLIAEAYKNAAMNQLEDDNETPILWWGYGCFIARAGGYRIRDLRWAIEEAMDATDKRDNDMYGPSPWDGSTFSKQALMLAKYYEDKDDDFVMPQMTLEPRPGGNMALFVDGNVLCMNFEKLMISERKKFNKRRNKEDDVYADTSEVEKEHGSGSVIRPVTNIIREDDGTVTYS